MSSHDSFLFDGVCIFSTGSCAFLLIVVSFCAAEEGPESREEAKKARGGRMQHRGEGGGGERGKR